MNQSIRARANQWLVLASDENGGQPLDHQQLVSAMTAFCESELKAKAEEDAINGTPG